MSDGFKKGFLITLGILAALIVAGWVLKII
jgi:hypothetical protein